MGDQAQGQPPVQPVAAAPISVPRHVSDISDVVRYQESGQPNILDRTTANIQAWIAFRLVFYFECCDRGNVWATLVKGIYDHDNRPTHRHNAGTMLSHAELLDLDDAKVLGGRMLRRMLSPGMWLTKWLTYPPDSNPADWYQHYDLHYFGSKKHLMYTPCDAQKAWEIFTWLSTQTFSTFNANFQICTIQYQEAFRIESGDVHWIIPVEIYWNKLRSVMQVYCDGYRGLHMLLKKHHAIQAGPVITYEEIGAFTTEYGQEEDDNVKMGDIPKPARSGSTPKANSASQQRHPQVGGTENNNFLDPYANPHAAGAPDPEQYHAPPPTHNAPAQQQQQQQQHQQQQH